MVKTVGYVCAIAVMAAMLVGGSGTRQAEANAKGSKKMLWIAHRGESYIAPENTMAAFNLAWDKGVKFVELDCYLTKDNKIICSHDANTKRTGGVSMVIRESYAEDLRKVDIGKWKGEKYAGEKMPFIEEAFASIPKGGTIFCEIKCGPEILPFLRTALDASGKRSQVTIICFSLDVCARAKEMMPDLQVYYLSAPKKDPKTGAQMPYDDSIINACLDNNLDGLNIEYRLVTKEYVDRVKAAGLKMFVWTCDSVDDAKRLAADGVDGITSNRAAWLAQQLAE